jgi:predicted neutral ceramidase superfamily lipid hydrolase
MQIVQQDIGTARCRVMDEEYVSINMIYFSQAFVYLFTDMILFLLKWIFGVSMASQSISLTWLLGFFTSMIFMGINIIVPLYKRRFPLNTLKLEIIFLAIWAILLGITMNIHLLGTRLVPAVLVLLLSIVILTYSPMTVGLIGRKMPGENENSNTYGRWKIEV